MMRRLRRRVTGLLALGFVVTVLSGVFPVAAGLWRLLVVAEAPRRADAIVVLGGGVVDEDTPGSGTLVRLVHGLRLHRRGYAPVVILTGGNPVRPEEPESQVMRRVAEELGATPDVLVVETRADRTATQGEAVARIARGRGIRTILLVTSGEHSRRAALVFRKTGLDVVSTPAIPRRPPRLTITLHPRHVAERVCALLPASYEVAALGLYWWRGWL
jgi:uncharacterized SAM-binding protein YcdF (DUF218 family)